MAQRVRMKDGGSLVAIIADEDTIAGFLLAGVGSAEKGKNTNFLAVSTKTPKNQIEDAFKKFTTRDDIGVLLISQDIAEVIRHLLDDYEQLLPTVLEIPSKDHPYDSSKDGIMQRIKRMLGQD